MSRGGVGCRRGPGGMGSTSASAMAGGGRSFASSASLKMIPIAHMRARKTNVTSVRPKTKKAIDFTSISASKPRVGETGGARCSSAMAERLLERRFAVGQERSRLELAREEVEPEAAQCEGRSDVERVDVDVLRKRGR